MATNNHRILTREIKTTIIPAGDVFILPAGTAIDITHRLGGNFTIVSQNGMFRVKGEDADALGEEIPQEPLDSANDTVTDHSGPPSKEALWDALKTVFDPEIPVNIVDLGLVYSIEVDEMDDDGYGVNVQMTLTAPGCGMGPAIAEDAKNRLETVPGTTIAQVDIVWDPAWNQEMISEEGKMELRLI